MLINHMGISGGKDSTALLLWAIHESGYDVASIQATFCNTGNEAPATLDYIRFLSEHVHPIEWLEPDKDFFQLARHKGRFPSNRARFCTQALKLEPTQRHLFKLLDEGHEVLVHSGVKAEDSAHRARLAEFDIDSYFGLPVRRPLLTWTLEDVWAIHRRYGIHRNPLYDLGLRRVGCAPCFMCQKREIRIIAKHMPERIDRIRDEEEAVGPVATFFPVDKAPAAFRTKEILTKAGNTTYVSPIDEVVRWSQTGPGAKQNPLFHEEEFETCSHTSGACE